MMRIRATALVLMAAALAGCGDDPVDPGNGGSRTLVIVSGDNQSGQTGSQLASPLTVRVDDEGGDPVSGVEVAWALQSAAGPGSDLSASSGTTDAAGTTSIDFTLGDAAGTYEVRASISGSTVTFSATATAIAGGELELVSGGGQVGFAGSILPEALVVEVMADGSPVQGADVTFDVTESAGSGAGVDPAVATTDAAGRASTVLTLGDASGPVTVRASVNGFTVDIGAYACGGDAAGLNLSVGEDAVLTGADLNCVQLPAATGETEYEVVYTPLPQTLGFTSMELVLTGPAGSPRIVNPAPVASRVFRSVARERVGEGTRPDWRRTQHELDMYLRELERPWRAAAQAAATRGSGFDLMAAPPQVGDVMDFQFSCVFGSPMFPNAPETITAEAIAVGTNAVVFEDTLSRGSFTGGEYTAIVDNFTNNIVPTDHQYFGTPGDVPGDIAPGQVVILYTQGVNQLTENYAQGYIAGFFCGADLVPGAGNDAKMFYLMVPDSAGDYTPGSDADILVKEEALRITDNTVAHEYQHLINFQVGSGAAAEVGTNEGLSHLAEEVVGHAAAQSQGLSNFAPGNELGPSDILTAQGVPIFNKWYIFNFQNLATYLFATRDTAALLNASDPGAPGTFRLRGANWMFLRYLLDRFGTPATEWQLTQALITDGATNHRDAITNVFGVPYEELVADWTAMLVLEDTGVPVRDDLTLPSWQLRALYDDPAIGIAISPTGAWPLSPEAYALGTWSVDPGDLFAGTSGYVTLSSAGAAGATGLRLQMAGTGANVPGSVMPVLVITRTK